MKNVPGFMSVRTIRDTLLMGLLLTLLFAPATRCQETDLGTRIALPELFGYKLENGKFLIFNSQVTDTHATFIKVLRHIPAIHSDDIPTTLLIDKYLHRKSQAIETEFCYLESDWLSRNELEYLAAVVAKASQTMRALFIDSKKEVIKEVFFKNTEDYLAMVDTWAEGDITKKQARQFTSIYVGDFRCGYRKDFAGALTLAIADAVSQNVSASFQFQDALLQGLHTYLCSLIALRHQSFVEMNC